MSRYQWPGQPGGDETEDAPGKRARFNTLGRLELNPLQAPRPRPAAPGLRAPANGREHLWQPLGPHTVVGGQAEGGPRISGRINALAVHPDGERLYAVSGHGGVWYSRDGGASWASLGGLASTDTSGINRPAQRHACGAIQVAFGATEADDLVFVGTGDPANQPDAEPGTSLGGVGILVGQGPAAAAGPDPWVREAKNLIGNAAFRIVREPGGSTVVAATRTGLFQRPAVPGADVDWVRPAGTPFDTLADACTDVLWTAADGARPARLWVWVRTGPSGGLWVRDDGQVNFTKIATAGTLGRRASLAASTPPDLVWVLNDRPNGTLPLLYRVAAAGGGTPVATLVTGVPDILKTQGFYDIAIDVDPAHPERVVLGGSFMDATLPDGTVVSSNGAIVVADVVASGASFTYGSAASPFTMIGVGVHADVHDLRYSNGGARLWVGCDGGVFRSDRPTSMVGFYARNHGITVAESNFLGNHAASEGHVAAGLQDNAVITRHSNGVWKLVGLGDGGGIAFDPLRPDRFMRQHFQGFWSSSDGVLSGTELLDRAGTFAQNEFDASAFYSMPAGIAHRRGSPAPAIANVGQIILGTHRLWYTENFGTSWVTLPTGTDPLPANLVQDSLGQAITVCRWQTPDVAWVLTPKLLTRYARTAGSDNGGGPGSWAMQTVVAATVNNKNDGSFAFGPMRDAVAWTEVAVNLDAPGTARGTLGALYLGTSGKASDSAVDTLWWFDGTGVWMPTGLRNHAQGVGAPVTAVVCDAAFPDEVYVGTTVGVWKGTRSFAGGLPSWNWEKRLNGLPEAAVEDLAILNDGGLRLLRAAIAARGVWELRLDSTEVGELTYVRAHQDDLRYRTPTVPPAVPLRRDGSTPRSWHGSPDVRPRVAPVPLAAPAAPAWVRGGANVDAEKLRRFQAALRSLKNDPRVRATGQWDSYFNEVLREHGAPLLPSPPAAANTVSIGTAYWNAAMALPHGRAEPWGSATPTEADLHDFTPPLEEGDVGRTSCSLPRRACKVDIVVHHRGLDARDGADVRVTLLKWLDPRTRGASSFSDSATWFSDPVPWTAAVNEVLNGATGASSQSFAAGWSFVGTTNATRRLTLAGQTLDPLHSGVASFDIDLSGLRRNRVLLLVAVIRAGADVALQPATLHDLALSSPNVAVRSVRLFP
ncbi:hypothetical protein HZ992_18040 [Rhizobacter sp. AJA081-3]|uniref:hypothetical protein n=1 Tax=Rhizobacter sp. AJA081-3 TaxID=2753607 RepID=UPI001ADF49DA|nr:hypothetical protein [Rhizobacter sp. AJA081-3]QTN22047.1 hypothetical protein HZ992_18040 [Rhizobacter sp. AJA081-3]